MGAVFYGIAIVAPDGEIRRIICCSEEGCQVNGTKRFGGSEVRGLTFDVRRSGREREMARRCKEGEGVKYFRMNFERGMILRP